MDQNDFRLSDFVHYAKNSKIIKNYYDNCEVSDSETHQSEQHSGGNMGLIEHLKIC